MGRFAGCVVLACLGCTAPGETIDLSHWHPPWEDRGEVSGPHCTVLVDKQLFEGDWVHTWRVVDPVKEWPIRPPAPAVEVRWAIGERYLQSGDAGGDPTATWAIESHVRAERSDDVCEWRVLGIADDFRDAPAMRVDWWQELIAPPGLRDVEPVPLYIRPGDDVDALLPTLTDDQIRVRTMYTTGTHEIVVEHVYDRR